MNAHFFKQRIVAAWLCNNCYACKIFSSRTYHRWPADVNMVNAIICRSATVCIRFKRVQINNNHVDKLNVMFLCLLHVGIVGVNSQQRTVNARMKRFHAPVHNFRKTRNVRYIANRYARFTQSMCTTTCGNKLNAKFVNQRPSKGYHVSFVSNRNKNTFNATI